MPDEWRYLVSVRDRDGSPIPGASVTIQPVGEEIRLAWYARPLPWWRRVWRRR